MRRKLALAFAKAHLNHWLADAVDEKFAASYLDFAVKSGGYKTVAIPVNMSDEDAERVSGGSLPL